MYRIKIVDDEELPEGHDFAFVYTDECAAIFYRESAVTERNLEDSWAAYRAMSAPDRPGGQMPRLVHSVA